MPSLRAGKASAAPPVGPATLPLAASEPPPPHQGHQRARGTLPHRGGGRRRREPVLGADRQAEDELDQRAGDDLGQRYPGASGSRGRGAQQETGSPRPAAAARGGGLRKRGSGPKTLSVASCPALLGETMALLESRVYANSNQHSVAARKRLLEDSVQCAALSQERRPWPLTPGVVKGFAGSLMTADFGSAQNYLIELKCRARERENGEDAAISDSGIRALVISKNAANRGLGPSGMAPVVGWDDVSLGLKDTEGLDAGELRAPLRPWRVACGWLLHEIEVASATLADVAPSRTPRRRASTCPPPRATRRAKGSRASGDAGTRRTARARRPARCAP